MGYLVGTPIVYVLDASDVDAINDQRTMHAGDYGPAEVGQTVPGVVVSTSEAGCADLHLHLPGTDSLYVTSRPCSESGDLGTFRMG